MDFNISTFPNINPFLFAGFIYDTTSNYDLPFLTVSAMQLIGSCCIWILAFRRRRVNHDEELPEIHEEQKYHLPILTNIGSMENMVLGQRHCENEKFESRNSIK